MKKLLQKTAEGDQENTTPAAEESQELPAKGTLTDKAGAPAPAKEKKAKAPPKPKAAQTTLDNGLTYALISRVRNAYSKDKRAEMEKGAEVIKMTDGKGSEHEISAAYVKIALELGVDYLKSVRTAAVKKKLGLAAPKKEKAPKAPKEKKAKVTAPPKDDEEAPADPDDLDAADDGDGEEEDA